LDENGNLLKTIENTIDDKPLPDATYRPIGFFAENELNVNPKLLLSLGGRIDFIHTENELTYKTYTPETDEILWEEESDDDISWSLQTGAVYRPTQEWSANWVVARSFRAPSLEERYQYIDLGGLVKIGDPNLDPEDGWFSEVGLTYQKSIFSWNAQGFMNSTKNLVIEKFTKTADGKEALKKVNAGEALMYGFESEINWAPMPRWLFSADITYTRGKDQETEENLPAMPPLNGNVRIRYSQNSGIWSELGTKWAAEQNETAPDEAKTDGYATVDIKLGYKKLVLSGIEHNFTLGIKNIFDAQYKNHLTSSRGFDLYEPGRSFYISWGMGL
jgi:outer membrane receptor protein involved in Fe transport